MPLNIDLGLQKYAVDKLSEHPSAAAVTLDVRTGAVLSLVSVPGYDPNAFNIGLSRKQWRSIRDDPHAPLTNKAVSGLYAPGSTFKMVVALAALKHGVVRPDERVNCVGHMELGRGKFHCWKRHGHGWVNMHEALQQSCDVYFYELAKRLGVDRIASMAKVFGLGNATGIDLPGERSGLIPTAAWKKRAVGVPWQRGETLVAAIGQGFMLTTPLQLAVMTARLATGKAVKPSLLRAIVADGVTSMVPPETGQPALPVNPAHLALVLKGMDAVVNSAQGTARQSKLEGVDATMAGKTGTAQVRRISKRERETRVLKNHERPWKERDHALFVGYAPVKDPRYAVAVVVEHGGGGSAVAAPIARDILQETLRADPSGYGRSQDVDKNAGGQKI